MHRFLRQRHPLIRLTGILRRCRPPPPRAFLQRFRDALPFIDWPSWRLVAKPQGERNKKPETSKLGLLGYGAGVGGGGGAAGQFGPPFGRFANMAQ